MFDDDQIGRQATYEHFHRTRLARERTLHHRPVETPETIRRQGTWPQERDRFEHIFKQSDRLW